MTSHYHVFYNLFQRIPTYGFGSVTELEVVRIHFIETAKKLIDTPEHKEFAEQVIRKAAEIESKVALAENAGNEKLRRKSFDTASNELALCVESVIWKIEEAGLMTRMGSSIQP